MNGTKVTLKHGSGKPNIGSLAKAELAVDLDNLELWTCKTDGGNPEKISGQSDSTDGNIADNTAQIEINKGDISDNAAQIEINKGNIADNAILIEANSGDIANNAAQIEINKDNIAEHEVEINANKEAIDTLDADAVKKSVTALQSMVGDLKAKSFEGDGSKLSGITTDQLADVNSAGAVKDEFLIYNGSSWIAEAFHIDTELTYQGSVNLTLAMTVTPVNGDLYINDTEGVVHSSWVGIAGVTVRAGNVIGYATKNARWYLLGDIASSSVTDVEGGSGIDVDDSKPAEPVVSIDRAEVDTWYEPKFAKLSAFNKNFGTTAGTVSEGNHVHNEYITTETDPTVPTHVKNISTTDIANWNAPETDPTVPAHVKSISTADIARWNTPAGAAPVSSVNGKTGAVSLSHTDVGAVGIGSGGSVSAPKIVIGSTGSDPNTLYFVV